MKDGGASERDRAANRAARAARTLATVAHNAAREHVQRDAVTTHLHRDDADVVPAGAFEERRREAFARIGALDVAERERQARLRRWHEPPHPNRKDG